MTAATERSRPAVAGARPRYAEVWGDTVDIAHLGWAVLLGVVISFGAFEIAWRLLRSVVADAAMARAYAMLAGLAGCLAAGAVSGACFKPKRVVVDEASDETRRAELVEKLVAEAGAQGRTASLPPAVVAEMKEVGLYDLFVAAEARQHHVAAASPSLLARSTTREAAR